MQGGSKVALSAITTLTPTTVEQVWAIPPINVEFLLRGFTISGISVDLKVTEKSNYDSVRWVRYSAGANGSYQVWQVSSPSGIGLVLTKLIISCSYEWDIYVHLFHSQSRWISLHGAVIRHPIVRTRDSTLGRLGIYCEAI